MVNLLLVDVILEALAHFNPEPRASRIPARRARSASPGARRGRARSNMQYEIVGSAYGGGMGHDGATATATHLSNLHTTPIEILESEFPCRITRFDLVPDSGGAGQLARRARHAARIRAAGGCDRHPPLQQDPFPAQGRRRRRGRAARPLRGPGRHRRRNTRRRPRRASRCRRASASCCKAPAAAATAIRRKRDRAALARDVAEGYVVAGRSEAKDTAAR